MKLGNSPVQSSTQANISLFNSYTSTSACCSYLHHQIAN
jgi:hypothetical protein